MTRASEIEIEDANSAGEKVATFELTVCGFEKSPAHCVYINDFRIVGGKPWGGGRTTAGWKFTLTDLRQAFPTLEINPTGTLEALQADNAKLREDAGLWDWMAQNVGLELSWLANPEEDAVWCIHRRHGGYNDREWDLIATADTPIEALRSARAALISGDRG